LDEGKDVALEGGEVGELAIALVPLSRFPFALDVGRDPAGSGIRAVSRITTADAWRW
jgi:hypothetical protein